MTKEETFKLKILKTEMTVRIYVDKLPRSCRECPAKMWKYGQMQCKYIAHLPGPRGHEMWHPIFPCPVDTRHSECPMVETPMTDEEKEKEELDNVNRKNFLKEKKRKQQEEIKLVSDTEKPYSWMPCKKCYYAHKDMKTPVHTVRGNHGTMTKFRSIYCTMLGEKRMIPDEISYYTYYQGSGDANDKLPDWCPRLCL